MKIAFIVSRFPSLSETFILNQITGLIVRGYEVDVFAKGSENQPVTHVDIEKYNLLSRTFYYGAVYQTISPNKSLRVLKAIGLMIKHSHKQPMPLLKSLNVFKYGMRAASLTLFYEIATFLERGIGAYDIVHCHFGPTGNLGALLKDVGAIRGKLVTKFYGHDVSIYVKRNGQQVYKRLFAVGDLFLPISDRMKDQLMGLGCERQRIVVHRLGVDTSQFTFYPRQLREDGKVRLLTIARLVEKKGLQYSIQAVAKVLENYPQLEYKIIGDGPLKGELQSLIETLKIGNRVQLLGWKRQDEVIQLVREADILLAPSVTSENGDEEGTPVALMEALAQGLPVISTQHSGIPELVEEGQSGFLVPERDVIKLAEKLEYLIKCPQLWPKLGRMGREHVEQYYDINKLNDQLVQLYQQLLNGKLLPV